MMQQDPGGVMFIQIQRETLEQVYQNHPKTILYFSKNPVVREIFWRRLKTLYKLMDHANHSKDDALDFGGGNGVFLPSLSRLFNHVTCIDLDTQRASKIAALFDLKNVKMISGDLNNESLLEKPVNVVVAADVLEHFKDLSRPVRSITRFLKDGGFLYTSLPSENRIYVLLRKIFKLKKPVDHYHSGVEVEKFLSSNGFQQLRRRYIPFRFFPLFLVSEWKKNNSGL
jgi:2-polyprenyl-3-methyl-5-hydroxy-6-metoxy-1,4-benzoquinol methylase